jgi:outer membrane protein assembly factor BamB
VKFRAVISLLLIAVLTFGWPVTAVAYGISDPGRVVPAASSARQLASRAPLSPVVPNGSWPVYHRDNAHTGFDPTLPGATGVTAGWTSVGFDERVFTSPVVYGGLVYAGTLANTVYAVNQSDGSIQWSRNLGAPETGPWNCGNIDKQGILGTPVVDPTTNRIYAVTLQISDHHYRLEGLNLATGLVETTTDISAFSIPLGFDWHTQQQRGALAVANGVVYVPFGGRWGDCTPYHGWVFAVPTDGITPITNYYMTPGNGSGFWAAGGVVVDDSTGKVFVTSGNGKSGCNANPDGSPQFEENAVVRLSATLAHEDAFVPQDWRTPYCTADQDLGGAGPLLISPNLMFQAGKPGGGFLLNPNALGGLDGQLFPTPKPQPYAQADVCAGNHANATFGSFAYAAPFIYLECEGRGIVALKLDTSTPSFSLCGAGCPAPSWQAGAGITFGPPIVAGGLVWAATSGGGMYAFQADTGAQVFHSASFGINRFVTPAAAGGQVFVPQTGFNSIRQFVMQFGALQSSPAPVPARDPVVPAPVAPGPGRPPVNQSTPAPPPFGR